MRPCGTRSAYVGGCRCSQCRAAEAAYRHRLRQGDAPLDHPCWFCRRSFHSERGAKTHMGKVH